MDVLNRRGNRQSIVVRLTLWECNTSVTIVNRNLVVEMALFTLYQTRDSRTGRRFPAD